MAWIETIKFEDGWSNLGQCMQITPRVAADVIENRNKWFVTTTQFYTGGGDPRGDIIIDGLTKTQAIELAKHLAAIANSNLLITQEDVRRMVDG